MSKKVFIALVALFAILLFHSVQIACAQNVADKLGRPWEVDKDAIVVNPGGSSAASSMMPVPRPGGSEAAAVTDRWIRNGESGMTRVNNQGMFSPIMAGRSFMELFNFIFLPDRSSH